MAAEAPADAAMTAAEAEAHLLVIFSLSPQAQRQVQRCERVDEKATTAFSFPLGGMKTLL